MKNCSAQKILIIFMLMVAPGAFFGQGLPLDEIDLVEMPLQNNKALLKAEEEAREPGRPNHFAVALDVEISPETHGNWTEEDGDALWQLRIKSNSAKSLNLGFSNFSLPENAALLIASPDGKTTLPPFTAADEDNHGELWTPMVPGDEIVLELRVSSSHKSEVDLKVTSVNHDFTGWGAPSSSSASGACNLDVVCGEDDGWDIVDPHRDIIQSVGVYTINGTLTCTGALINNTAQDCTPYFLTANHCGINSGNAPSVVVYWNFENSECRQPNSAASGQEGDGQLDVFNTGAVLRANYQPSDVTLIELDDELNESANAFLAGWNRQDESFDTAIAIHHPNTDEKRISFENDPGSITGYLEDNTNPSGTHVRVEDWDVGTTEPGSSGSPLYDQDERIIGQLHGGYAACSNNDPDWYGRIHISWEGGGTSDSRLKDWLDPNNSGVMTLDGKSCSFLVSTTESSQSVCAPETATFQLSPSGPFQSDVQMSIANLPSGLSAEFSDNPVQPNNSTTLTISNTDNVASGTYQLEVQGQSGQDIGSVMLTLTIANGTPGNPGLISPENGADNVSIFPSFYWNANSANIYDFQIANDADFSNIEVDEAGVEIGEYHAADELQLGQTYFWRIRASNTCGMGDWSETRTFTVAEEISCNEFSGQNLPVVIDAGAPADYTVEINVESGTSVFDLNVLKIAGEHTWISDLTFELTSPEGTTVTLLSEQCDDEDGFDIGFDDDASGNFPCPFDDGQLYPPQEALSAFNGENAQGIWTLTVADGYFFDGGEIQQVELEICSAGVTTVRENNSTSFSVFPNPTKDVFVISLNRPFAKGASAKVVDLSGKVVLHKTLSAGNNREELSLRDQPPGIYIVRLITQDAIVHKRIVKQ